MLGVKSAESCLFALKRGALGSAGILHPYEINGFIYLKFPSYCCPAFGSDIKQTA